jgi:small subunit ribosomal protein S2
MTKLPEAVFVLDIDKDRTAIKEAQKKGIKTIALVDTNDNPEGLDYFIPANNDALSSLEYILKTVAEKIKKVQKTDINKK